MKTLSEPEQTNAKNKEVGYLETEEIQEVPADFLPRGDSEVKASVRIFIASTELRILNTIIRETVVRSVLKE